MSLPSEELPCPKCGKRWVRWAGSTLLSHAKCYLSDEEKEALLVRRESDPKLTTELLALESDLPIGVVRSSLYYAQVNRREGAR